jgi:hypothetical protein
MLSLHHLCLKLPTFWVNNLTGCHAPEGSFR